MKFPAGWLNSSLDVNISYFSYPGTTVACEVHADVSLLPLCENPRKIAIDAEKSKPDHCQPLTGVARVIFKVNFKKSELNSFSGIFCVYNYIIGAARGKQREPPEIEKLL